MESSSLIKYHDGVIAEAFRSLLELEGVLEGGLDAWTEGLPPRIPDLRLTQLIHALTLLLLAAAPGLKGEAFHFCLLALQVRIIQCWTDHGRGEGGEGYIQTIHLHRVPDFVISTFSFVIEGIMCV